VTGWLGVIDTPRRIAQIVGEVAEDLSVSGPFRLKHRVHRGAVRVGCN